jgi:hypothetical protein
VRDMHKSYDCLLYYIFLWPLLDDGGFGYA